MFPIFNFQLSFKKMCKMDGKRVYVFSERSWATISMEGSYPLLILENGGCMSWEDWPDGQIDGVYIRPPFLKMLLARYKNDLR